LKLTLSGSLQVVLLFQAACGFPHPPALAVSNRCVGGESYCVQSMFYPLRGWVVRAGL